MFPFGCIFVLAAVVQTISTQEPPPFPSFPPGLPEQCRGPPTDVGRPQECCKIPPFFTAEEFKECGFQKIDDEETARRHGPPDCSKQLCMMKKYNLLKDETTVDHEQLSKFLDKWAETNGDFKPAIESVKSRCVGKDLPGPPHICEANKLVFCISSTIFAECPAWETTDGCKKLKDHMEECAPFFQELRRFKPPQI